MRKETTFHLHKKIIIFHHPACELGEIVGLFTYDIVLTQFNYYLSCGLAVIGFLKQTDELNNQNLAL